MAWNRVDIARSEIFTDEWQWKVGCRVVCKWWCVVCKCVNVYVQKGCVCIPAGFQLCLGTLTRQAPAFRIDIPPASPRGLSPEFQEVLT